jgi:hypothetical protein
LLGPEDQARPRPERLRKKSRWHIQRKGLRVRLLGGRQAGANVMRNELLFLTGLDIEVLGSIEILPDSSPFLTFTDVYRMPAFGADDLVHFEKPSEDNVEQLAALGVLAAEGVKELVEVADRHDASPSLMRDHRDEAVQRKFGCEKNPCNG